MKLKAPFATAIAIAVGLVILLGYFVPALLGLRQFLLQWAIALAATALLVGVVNLLSVHTRRVIQDETASAIAGNSVYSIVLIVSLVITLIVVLALGPNHLWSQWTFKYIQVPIEASLMGVLAISLAYASAGLLRRRTNAFSMIFTITVLLVLLGTGPFLLSQFPMLGEWLPSLKNWITQVPAAAGARGILLGVALGIIATGIRILMGADRPYGR